MSVPNSIFTALLALLLLVPTGCAHSDNVGPNSDSNLIERMDDSLPFMAKLYLWVAQYRDVELSKKNRQDANQLTLQQKSSIEIADLASVRDMSIPSAEGAIAVRVYTPKASGPLPIFLYIHGGGWWTGDDFVTDAPITHLAEKANAIVVSVDYRLAPEFPYPAAFNDCYAVLQWLSRNAQELGGDPSRLAVGGGSAGANLTAAITIKARDEQGPNISFQYLLVPVLDLSGTYEWPSMKTIGSAYPVFERWGEAAVSAYAPDPQTRLTPYVSPMLADSFHDLPPALIATAEFDGLRDQGEAYGEKLKQAGVPVEVIRYQGAFHAFVRSPETLMENISLAALMLREAFSEPLTNNTIESSAPINTDNNAADS